jgi:ankyrin repeat protein
MKKIMQRLCITLLCIGCNNNENVANEKNLLGNDFRLFQNTSAWELAKSVENEDTLKIRKEISEEKSKVNFQEPKFGSTLLMLSIKNDKYRSAKVLLELGANPNIPDSYRGESAVISAAEMDDPKYLKLILEYNGNPNALESVPFKENDEVRQTALLAAINPLESSSLDKVKMLVKAGANVNFYNLGHTDLPLAEAITDRKMEVALYLLQNGADSNLVMYETIDGRKVYILEALRKCIFDLNSKEYSDKQEVINFLKVEGLDYSKEPIPDYILMNIKEQYPEDWENFIKNY